MCMYPCSFVPIHVHFHDRDVDDKFPFILVVSKLQGKLHLPQCLQGRESMHVVMHLIANVVMNLIQCGHLSS